MRPNALFGLAFATATPHRLTKPHTTNSQAHSSKGTPSPSPKAQPRRIVSTWFQVLFHSPPGVLFTFPSRYSSAIGHQVVFRLSGWSRQIHSKFHELAATWEIMPDRTGAFAYGALTHYGRFFQFRSTNTSLYHCPSGRQTRPHHSHNPANATPAGYHTPTV